MINPEPRMSFSKNHAAEKSKGVTQLLRVESKELKVNRCYGFEQQQRNSAQIASRSRNPADSL